MLEPAAESSAVEEARQRMDGVARIVVRPIASPVALGLYGLAAGTLVLAGQQLGWVDQAERKPTALMLIAFPFVAQLIASIWSTLARDGTAATAMGVLALTWLSTGLVQFSTPAGSTSDALGLLLLFSAAAMALTGSTALQSKVFLGVVFLTAATRFALGGLHQLTAEETWEDSAGVVGLVLFVFAIYAAFAGELEDAQGKTVLPIGRRMKGRLAVEGSLAEQLKHVPNEPGVRQQL
jgi:succinate-acetate transporter protein